MAKTFKIHPAIGFARLGNSPESVPRADGSRRDRTPRKVSRRRQRLSRQVPQAERMSEA
jgi:hypothetical protein